MSGDSRKEHRSSPRVPRILNVVKTLRPMEKKEKKESRSRGGRKKISFLVCSMSESCALTCLCFLPYCRTPWPLTTGNKRKHFYLWFTHEPKDTTTIVRTCTIVLLTSLSYSIPFPLSSPLHIRLCLTCLSSRYSPTLTHSVHRLHFNSPSLFRSLHTHTPAMCLRGKKERDDDRTRYPFALTRAWVDGMKYDAFPHAQFPSLIIFTCF